MTPSRICMVPWLRKVRDRYFGRQRSWHSTTTAREMLQQAQARTTQRGSSSCTLPSPRLGCYIMESWFSKTICRRWYLARFLTLQSLFPKWYAIAALDPHGKSSQKEKLPFLWGVFIGWPSGRVLQWWIVDDWVKATWNCQYHQEDHTSPASVVQRYDCQDRIPSTGDAQLDRDFGVVLLCYWLYGTPFFLEQRQWALLSLSLSPRNERSVTRCLQYSLRLISTFALLVDYSKSLLQKCLAFIGRIFKRLDWLMEENRTKCCYYDWLVQRSLVMNNGIEAQIFV